MTHRTIHWKPYFGGHVKKIVCTRGAGFSACNTFPMEAKCPLPILETHRPSGKLAGPRHGLGSLPSQRAVVEPKSKQIEPCACMPPCCSAGTNEHCGPLRQYRRLRRSGHLFHGPSPPAGRSCPVASSITRLAHLSLV